MYIYIYGRTFVSVYKLQIFCPRTVSKSCFLWHILQRDYNGFAVWHNFVLGLYSACDISSVKCTSRKCGSSFFPVIVIQLNGKPVLLFEN